MSLLIRERPPLRLAMSVNHPEGGQMFQWAADRPDVRNVPDGLTFTTTAPGGFEQATCTLNRDPRIDWPDLHEFATVTITGIGGAQVAFQGRIEEFPSTAGQQSNFQPQIYGWVSHLSDNGAAAMIYLDADLTKWQGPSTARAAAVVGAGFIADNGPSVAPDGAGNPSLVTALNGVWSGAGTVTEAFYDGAYPGAIAKLFYAWERGNDLLGPTDPNWSWLAFLSSDGVDSPQATGNLSADGPSSGTLTATTPLRYAGLQLFYAVAAGTDGQTYPIDWTSLQVIGPHGLTLQGSGPYGLLASDIIAHAVATWAPKIAFTTGPAGTIQPSAFQIGQAVYSATNAAAIIADAAKYELLDWFVWEGPTGPTLYVNPRGARGRQWVARVGPAQLQNAGSQSSSVVNAVIVQFTAPDGTTQTVGPTGTSTNFTDDSLKDPDPENPVNKAGLGLKTPTQLVNIGKDTLAGAVQIGATYLQAQKAANTSGQAALVGHVQDNSGAWWPAWLVRAGDTVSFVDAADSSPRRIISTSYEDASKTNTIQLDQPPDTLDALLARMGSSLS